MESKHAKDLVQLPANRVISSNPSDWKCDFTGVTDNLWLNLSDGTIGSGRPQWDGSGGNGTVSLLSFGFDCETAPSLESRVFSFRMREQQAVLFIDAVLTAGMICEVPS